MIIAVLNEKGGAGKTTLATHLARAFQLEGARVLLVDSDPQGSARDWHAAAGDEVNLPPIVAMDRAGQFRDLPGIAQGYDWTIVDGTAKASDISLAAIKTADLVLIPVQPSPYDVWAAESLVEVVKARQELTNGKPKAAFVVSRQIVGTRLASEVRTALEGYGLPILEAGTCQRVAYANCATTGATVLDIEPTGTAATEICELLKEVRQYANR